MAIHGLRLHFTKVLINIIGCLNGISVYQVFTRVDHFICVAVNLRLDCNKHSLRKSINFFVIISELIAILSPRGPKELLSKLQGSHLIFRALIYSCECCFIIIYLFVMYLLEMFSVLSDLLLYC